MDYWPYSSPWQPISLYAGILERSDVLCESKGGLLLYFWWSLMWSFCFPNRFNSAIVWISKNLEITMMNNVSNERIIFFSCPLYQAQKSHDLSSKSSLLGRQSPLAVLLLGSDDGIFWLSALKKRWVWPFHYFSFLFFLVEVLSLDIFPSFTKNGDNSNCYEWCTVYIGSMGSYNVDCRCPTPVHLHLAILQEAVLCLSCAHNATMVSKPVRNHAVVRTGRIDHHIRR